MIHWVTGGIWLTQAALTHIRRCDGHLGLDSAFSEQSKVFFRGHWKHNYSPEKWWELKISTILSSPRYKHWKDENQYFPGRVVVQWLSSIWPFVTPLNCSTSGFPILHYLAVMLSNHLIFCCPFFPLALSLSQHQSLFQWVSSSHHVEREVLFFKPIRGQHENRQIPPGAHGSGLYMSV